MGALDKLANKLYGGNRLEVSASLASVDTYTYLAEAVSDSEDGLVSIVITDDVTQAEGIEDDGEWLSADELSTAISVPTTVSVKAGDVVMVTASGAEVLNPMVVTGVVGRGDIQQAQIDEAQQKADSVEGIAQQALTIAEATGQHFWPGDDGIHVTEVTEEQWKDRDGPYFQSGMNVLINSLGQLFRNGRYNLLELFPAGLRIYDGNGNQQSNLLAEFGPRDVYLAKQFSDTEEDQRGTIDFFSGRSKLYVQSNNEPLYKGNNVSLYTEQDASDAQMRAQTESQTYLIPSETAPSTCVANHTIQASLSDGVIGQRRAEIDVEMRRDGNPSTYLGTTSFRSDVFDITPSDGSFSTVSVRAEEYANEIRTATKTLTLTNLGGSPQLTLTRRGHWVLAQMNNVVTPSKANSNIACGTVPTGYRPTKDAFYSGVGVVGTTLGGFFRWRIQTSGNIEFNCSATGARECQLLAYWYTNDAWPTS